MEVAPTVLVLCMDSHGRQKAFNGGLGEPHCLTCMAGNTPCHQGLSLSPPPQLGTESTSTGQCVPKRRRTQQDFQFSVAELLSGVSSDSSEELGVSLSTRLQRVRELNQTLGTLLEEIPDEERLNWCALLETMAVRRQHKEVSFSISIAPEPPDKPFHLYQRHADELIALQSRLDCFRSTENVQSKRENLEFEWASRPEDTDDKLSSASHSFESYVLEQLNEEGKLDFIVQHFYAGAALDTKHAMELQKD